MSKRAHARTALWAFVGLAYGLTWLFWIPAALSGRDVTQTAWVIAYALGGSSPLANSYVYISPAMVFAGLAFGGDRLKTWVRWLFLAQTLSAVGQGGRACLA